MILNQQTHNYLLLFPKTFFDKYIYNYYDFFKKYMKIPYSTLDDYINSTIQNVEFPGWNMDLVEQYRMYGALQKFKNSTPVKDLMNKKFTITFKLSDAFFNYFILYHNAIKYLDFRNKNLYFDDFKILLLNNENYLVSIIELHKVIMTNMTSIKLQYSNMMHQHNTFNASFEFNDWDLIVKYNNKLMKF